MSVIEFQAWPKTPRLFRDVTITEKIDGTNAAIHIVHDPAYHELGAFPEGHTIDPATGLGYRVGAQSRKRLIFPGDDNFGFAAWVAEHATTLVSILGEGVHYGEWWGSGIQRGYGLTKGEKRFSLFNVHRYGPLVEVDGVHQLVGLDVVPVLYEGPFDQAAIRTAIWSLRTFGSLAARGFRNPEGVIVYHSASRSVYKVLTENDELPKGVAA